MASLTAKEQAKAAKAFSNFWKGKGYEKGESQSFWTDLLRDVFGVDNPSHFVVFEQQVKLDHTSFIDVMIPETHVMIEQKSLGKDLMKPIKQSDGSLLKPIEQAKRYTSELPYSERPRWIVTCNFEQFNVYDMEHPHAEPEIIMLKDLPKEYHRLSFLVNKGDENIKREMEISLKAGEIVGRLYDALMKQYKDPDSAEAMRSLNVLCVRLVFCFYAEDADVFGKHLMFHDYMKQFSDNPSKFRRALIDLFEILNTPVHERDPYMDESLAAFPYVNGGLFAKTDVVVPFFTDEIIKLILENASEDFDWSKISPTIFGAVFESTLNPETRRSGGMHYTSIENIHKVIDPLFLDELKAEFDDIKELKTLDARNRRLDAFTQKLASLKFLDPACGSGNFLTETYISIRRLENEALKLRLGTSQIQWDADFSIDPIKVKISQFYGIEINDFAVTVAKTALWIAESQMMRETESIINSTLEFLPLTTNAGIVEGNALRLDWESVVPKNELSYIMGNPPFVGARLMSKEQKDDLLSVFGKIKGLGDIDYVTGWYKKAAGNMKGTAIQTALVSTNSISQGEQPSILWSALGKDLAINFAHRTFRWDSEANEKAHVHCVIIGFSYIDKKKKWLYEDIVHKPVDTINAYLLNAPNVLVSARNKPLCNVPTMDFGSMPNDKGYLSNYSKEEKDRIVSKYPEAEKLFRRILGADEFINNRERWCLWLKGVSPVEYIDIPPVCEAIKAVEELRRSSKREATKKLADTPMLFGEIRQPESDYLLVPRVSSEKRKYVPIGFVPSNVIASDAVQILSSDSLFTFGVLTSNVHMAWMRAVAGRLKSDYRYSIKIVYNSFPWPEPTAKQKEQIEKTAQLIIDARAKYSDCSFAQLYGEKFSFFTDLIEAHRANDRAVMAAYGFPVKGFTESDCVAELMRMYRELTE